MQIETLAIDTLKPYAHNARTHSKRQIGQIAKSIKKFGFCNPVLIDDQRQICLRLLPHTELNLAT